MGLMDGLGAKFKTSTWGILCFIILNLLFNIFGFQEKRLVWAVKKVRQEAQAKEMVLNSKELERHQVMIETLKSIDNNAQQHSQLLVDSIVSLQKESAKELSNNFLIFGQIRNDINNNKRDLVDSLNKAHEHSLSKYEALFGQVQSSLDNNNKIATKNAKDNITELQKIASYNKATQTSMQDFVEKTVDSMASIGSSADKMAVAAMAVGSSAEGLNDVVENLRNELEGVMSMIKQDLSETISNMGNSFEENMSTMSKSMGQATLGISKAVDELSTSVDETMKEVTKVIGDSMDLQRKSANEFTVTSDALNGQIFEMTDLVKQLSGDITSGLKAVSESGRRMKSLDNRYDKYSDLIERVTETNQKLLNDNQQITSYLPQIIDAIPNLSSGINHTLSESVKIQRDSTNIFAQLSDDIKNALTVVSHSADRLETLNSRYEDYSILVESITQTNQKLLAKIDEKTTA
jgi:methyl-accepting chemotaxis protein